MEMPEYQKRVVQEKQELDEKIKKLEAFIVVPDFFQKVQNATERRLLRQQLGLMKSYSDCLGERINLFKRGSGRTTRMIERLNEKLAQGEVGVYVVHNESMESYAHQIMDRLGIPRERIQVVIVSSVYDLNRLKGMTNLLPDHEWWEYANSDERQFMRNIPRLIRDINEVG